MSKEPKKKIRLKIPNRPHLKEPAPPPEPKPGENIVTAVMNMASVRSNPSLAKMIEEYVSAAILHAINVEGVPPHSPTVTMRMDEARLKARADYAAMTQGPAA